MNQNAYQISCMCQHKLVWRHKVFRFQRILCETFQCKKSNKINVCNTYCKINCKIQMICLINSLELITVLLSWMKWKYCSNYDTIVNVFIRRMCWSVQCRLSRLIIPGTTCLYIYWIVLLFLSHAFSICIYHPSKAYFIVLNYATKVLLVRSIYLKSVMFIRKMHFKCIKAFFLFLVER